MHNCIIPKSGNRGIITNEYERLIMNRFLIIFSILTVTALAYSDARERLKELDEVAANTPAQVEMKPVFNNNMQQNKFENTNAPQQIQPPSSQTRLQQINKDDKRNEQNLKDSQQNRNDALFK